MKINNRLLYIFIIGFVFNLLFSQECPPADTLMVSAVQNNWNKFLQLKAITAGRKQTTQYIAPLKKPTNS